MLLLLTMVPRALADGPPGLELPTGEDPTAWRQAARLAGVTLTACTGGGGCAALRHTGTEWSLDVAVPGGTRRVLPVRAPEGETGREEVANLAAALLADVARGAGMPKATSAALASSSSKLASSPTSDSRSASNSNSDSNSNSNSNSSSSSHSHSNSHPSSHSTSPSLPAPPAPPAPVAVPAPPAPVAVPAPPAPVATPAPPAPVAAPAPPAPVAAPAPPAPVPAADPPPAPVAALAPPAPLVGASPADTHAPLAPWVTATLAVAWRDGTGGGPAVGIGAGLQRGAFGLGLDAVVTPARTLTAVGGAATLTTLDLGARLQWAPERPIAPLIGLSAGASHRAFADDAEPVAGFFVARVGVDAGVGFELGRLGAQGPELLLTPRALASLDLDHTHVARGPSTAQLTPWALGAGLALGARFP